MIILCVLLFSTLVCAAPRVAEDSKEKHGYSLSALQNEDSVSRLKTMIKTDLPTPVTLSDEEIKDYFASSDDGSSRPSNLVLRAKQGDRSQMWKGSLTQEQGSVPADAGGARLLADQGRSLEYSEDAEASSVDESASNAGINNNGKITISIDAVKIPNRNGRHGILHAINDQRENTMFYPRQWTLQGHQYHSRGHARPSSSSAEALALLTQKLSKMDGEMSRLKEAILLQGAVHIKTAERMEMLLLAQGKLAVKNDLDTRKLLKRVRRCCSCADAGKAERALRRRRPGRGQGKGHTTTPDSRQNMDRMESNLENNNDTKESDMHIGQETVRRRANPQTPNRTQSGLYTQGDQVQVTGRPQQHESKTDGHGQGATAYNSQSTTTDVIPLEYRMLTPEAITFLYVDADSSDSSATTTTSASNRLGTVPTHQSAVSELSTASPTSSTDKIASYREVSDYNSPFLMKTQTTKLDFHHQSGNEKNSNNIEDTDKDKGLVDNRISEVTEKQIDPQFTDATELENIVAGAETSETYTHPKDRHTSFSSREFPDRHTSTLRQVPETPELTTSMSISPTSHFPDKTNVYKHAENVNKVSANEATTLDNSHGGGWPPSVPKDYGSHRYMYQTATTRPGNVHTDSYERIKLDNSHVDNYETTTKHDNIYYANSSESGVSPQRHSPTGKQSSEEVPLAIRQHPTESPLLTSKKMSDLATHRGMRPSDSPPLVRQQSPGSSALSSEPITNADFERSSDTLTPTEQNAHTLLVRKQSSPSTLRNTELPLSVAENSNATPQTTSSTPPVPDTLLHTSSVRENSTESVTVPTNDDGRDIYMMYTPQRGLTDVGNAYEFTSTPSPTTTSPSTMSSLPTTTSTMTTTTPVPTTTVIATPAPSTTIATSTRILTTEATETTHITSPESSSAEHTTTAEAAITTATIAATTEAATISTAVKTTESLTITTTTTTSATATTGTTTETPSTATSTTTTETAPTSTTTIERTETTASPITTAAPVAVTTAAAATTTLEAGDRVLAVDLSTGNVENDNLPGVTWIVHPSTPAASRRRLRRFAATPRPTASGLCLMQGVLKFTFSPPSPSSRRHRHSRGRHHHHRHRSGDDAVEDSGRDEGEGGGRMLVLELEFHRPRGWVFNLGDSIANNGFSGDGSVQENDCEAQGYETTFAIFGSDKHPNGREKLLKVYNHFIQDNLTLTISDQTIAWDNHHGNVGNLTHASLFALSGQSDRQGPVNYDVYLGLNRVIAGHYRRGHGLCRVTARWLKG